MNVKLQNNDIPLARSTIRGTSITYLYAKFLPLLKIYMYTFTYRYTSITMPSNGDIIDFFCPHFLAQKRNETIIALLMRYLGYLKGRCSVNVGDVLWQKSKIEFLQFRRNSRVFT